MSADGRIYSNSKVVNFFHHSSFLGGAPTRSAGCIKVRDGEITGVNLGSGHYKPGPDQLMNFLDAIAIKIASSTPGLQRDAEYQRVMGGIHVSESFDTTVAVGPYYNGYNYWASRTKVMVGDPP
jgi:hypothetical protein